MPSAQKKLQLATAIDLRACAALAKCSARPSQAAPAEPTQPPGPLSVLDFRRRFTLHEKAAIEFAALDNPAAPIEERQQAALLRACLADQAAAQFIDLADPSTIAGVQLLVQAGLLSEERGQQVLLASAAP